jgi:tryptophan 2,3-dioxygenase
LTLHDVHDLFSRFLYLDNHLILVQRQIGNKQGTGGSAGYSYLRSTCRLVRHDTSLINAMHIYIYIYVCVCVSSDRYKVFIDLFNLASFLIPREFLPKLTTEMKMRLAVASVGNTSTDDTDEQDTSNTNDGKDSNDTGFMSKEAFRPVTD